MGFKDRLKKAAGKKVEKLKDTKETGELVEKGAKKAVKKVAKAVNKKEDEKEEEAVEED